MPDTGLAVSMLPRPIRYRREDIYEGQIMITEANIKSIAKHQVGSGDLKKAILEAAKRTRK